MGFSRPFLYFMPPDCCRLVRIPPSCPRQELLEKRQLYALASGTGPASKEHTSCTLLQVETAGFIAQPFWGFARGQNPRGDTAHRYRADPSHPCWALSHPCWALSRALPVWMSQHGSTQRHGPGAGREAWLGLA